jgi:multiple sugar transport system ATP-binding protein
VAVLRDGRLQQCAAPRDLYVRPANTFVAGFIGSPSMNLCTIPLSDGAVTLGGVSIAVPARATGGETIVVGFRPESLELATDGVQAHVDVVEEVGADSYVFCSSEIAGATTKLVARTETRVAPPRGSRISLRPRPAEAHLFDPETGVRVSI